MNGTERLNSEPPPGDLPTESTSGECPRSWFWFVRKCLILQSICLGIVWPSVGCSKRGAHPPLGEVFGVVMIDDRPLPQALISFRPIEGGRTATATSDANGHYELTYLVYPSEVKGASVGVNTVYVSTYQGNNGATLQARPELVPSCYRSPNSSIKVVVKKGRNEINLDLKTDCEMEITPQLSPTVH